MIVCRDNAGGRSQEGASSEAVRITSARVVEQGERGDPSIVRLTVDVVPNGRCHGHLVHLRDYLASRGLLLVWLVDVMEGGVATSDAGPPVRGVPRTRDRTSFVFSTARGDFERDTLYLPAEGGARGLVFVVSAIVAPIDAGVA